MRLIGVLALGLLVGCAQTSAPPQASREAAYVDLPQYVAGSGKVYESASQMVDNVVALGGVQKDLETNSEFNARMSRLGRSVVFSELRDSQIEFDKNSGEISFSQLLMDAQDFGYRQDGKLLSDYKHTYLSIAMPESNIVTGEYVGQNSFGASALIEEVASSRVYLVSPPIPKEPVGVIVVSLRSALKMSADQFKSQRSDLRLAIVFDSVPGYVQLQKFYGTATMANKRKTTVDNYFFNVRLAAASVINVKTGKIYSDTMRIRFKPL